MSQNINYKKNNSISSLNNIMATMIINVKHTNTVSTCTIQGTDNLHDLISV